MSGRYERKKPQNQSTGGWKKTVLIVVLVILAILAALLIPALTGYIDRAKEKSVIAETRQCVMAAQTLADEAYGNVAAGTAVTVDAGKVATLAEVSGTVSDIKFDGTNKSKITGLKYTKGTKVCTYDGTNYTVA